MKRTKILSIDPGTKEIGVAVLEGLDLVFYGVKTIRRPSTPQEVLAEAAKTIRNLIAVYRPSVLAIEKMFLVQKSASLLIVAAEEIKAVARREGLVVYEYAPTVVRKFICQTGRATKREAAKKVAARYPELIHYLNRQSEWETRYWANMFDAVAVGLICHEEILGEHDTSGI